MNVLIEYDMTAGVWFVADSDVPGLNAEARTQSKMRAILRDVLPDLVPNFVKDDVMLTVHYPPQLVMPSEGQTQ